MSQLQKMIEATKVVDIILENYKAGTTTREQALAGLEAMQDLLDELQIPLTSPKILLQNADYEVAASNGEIILDDEEYDDDSEHE